MSDHDHHDINDLFRSNRAWARRKLDSDPTYFSSLAEQQSPRYLWIGCSDSRVPATEIVDLAPGEMFVHRNIANVVPTTDPNSQGVVQFATEVLKVEHIIVTGHYGCGGIAAAASHTDHGQLDSWLSHIKRVYRRHYNELMAIADDKARLDRLCELNVIAQVHNVARLPTVQRAWRAGQALKVHGWIYGLSDGILRDLGVTLHGLDDLHPADRIEES